MVFSSHPDSEEKPAEDWSTQGKKEQIIQKRQRIITGLLVFVGIVAISLSIIQLNGAIESPFKPKKSSQKSNNTLNLNASEDDQLVQLKNKDTDKDGLNDFDELYVYKTSPYVKDSDSDGRIDKAEIDTGTDPNCPEGKACQGATTNPTETNTNTSTTGELSSQDLRNALKQMGAPASLVDSMDDQTLRAVYEETIQTTGLNPTNINTNSSVNLQNSTAGDLTNQAITLQSLQSFTATQIRDLLKQGGVDEATLNQVSDADLEAVFQEALSQQWQTTVTNQNTNG